MTLHLQHHYSPAAKCVNNDLCVFTDSTCSGGSLFKFNECVSAHKRFAQSYDHTHSPNGTLQEQEGGPCGLISRAGSNKCSFYSYSRKSSTYVLLSLCNLFHLMSGEPLSKESSILLCLTCQSFKKKTH